MKHLSTLFAALAPLLSGAAIAQTTITPPRQEPTAVREVVQQYLQIQSTGLPGRVEVKVGNLDSRMNVPACAALEAFMPSGSKVWGKTTVGVRCNAPSPWTIYVASSVHVWADYLAATAPLAQGQMIGQNDVARVNGDLTTLPPGVITDPGMAVGRTLALSVPAGAPVRRDALRMVQAIQQGQLVRLVTSGPGFKVSTEGRAIANAAEGQVAQARTAGGQLISGVAKLGGVVEVAY